MDVEVKNKIESQALKRIIIHLDDLEKLAFLKLLSYISA